MSMLKVSKEMERTANASVFPSNNDDTAEDSDTNKEPEIKKSRTYRIPIWSDSEDDSADSKNMDNLAPVDDKTEHATLKSDNQEDGISLKACINALETLQKDFLSKAKLWYSLEIDQLAALNDADKDSAKIYLRELHEEVSGYIEGCIEDLEYPPKLP